MARFLEPGERVVQVYRAAGKAWVQPDDAPGIVVEVDGPQALVRWPATPGRLRGNWHCFMDLERVAALPQPPVEEP